MTAIKRRDECVSPGCDTPTDPAEWPVVCRLCKPAVDEALDDYWTEHEPEMAELHHECVAEEAGLESGSRTPCENTWPDYDRDPGDPPHPIACSCSGRGWYGVDDGRAAP